MHHNYCFRRKQHSNAACDAALAASIIINGSKISFFNFVLSLSDETMNMSIIDDQSSSDDEDGKEAIESPTVESPIAEDFNERRSVQMKKYSNSISCLLYTSPSPRDKRQSRMPSSA